MFCNVVEQIHSQRFALNAFRGRHKRGKPVAVVPPRVKPDVKQLLQTAFTVGNFLGVEHVCAVDRFRVVVEHNVHVLRVHLGKKTLHVGKQLRVDVVAPSVYVCAPVGVDDNVVQRIVVPGVVVKHLQRFLVCVGVVFAVPRAES